MNLWQSLLILTSIACCECSHADEFKLQRCEVIPLPDHQVSLRVDGVQKLSWHFDKKYPRPFFYPFTGPSGISLTRMGHPGAENHDHHRSVWFASQKINDVDFWSDSTKAQIRQKHWYAYRDGQEEAVMACALGWFDENDNELVEQDLVAALRPVSENEHVVELQLTLRPGPGLDTVTLNKTNFGLLAVRVSKTLSSFFGGGRITDSEGRSGEENVFGKQARWMDYSGPVGVGSGSDRHVVTEGITYFDHPDNPHYPTFWHVRQDGWMGASFAMQQDHVINRQNPLILRYLLHAHSGDYNASRAEAVQAEFSQRPPFSIRKPTADERHHQYVVERKQP